MRMDTQPHRNLYTRKVAPLALISCLVMASACVVDVDGGEVETDASVDTESAAPTNGTPTTADASEDGSSTSSSQESTSGGPATTTTSDSADGSSSDGDASSSTGEPELDDPLTVEEACGGAGSFACEQCEVDGTFRIRLDHDDGGGYFACDDLPDGTICTISSEPGLPYDGVSIACEGVLPADLWDYQSDSLPDFFSENGLCGAAAAVAIDGASSAPSIALLVAPPGTAPIEDGHLFPELLVLYYGIFPGGGCQYSLHPVQ